MFEQLKKLGFSNEDIAKLLKLPNICKLILANEFTRDDFLFLYPQSLLVSQPLISAKIDKATSSSEQSDNNQAEIEDFTNKRKNNELLSAMGFSAADIRRLNVIPNMVRTIARNQKSLSILKLSISDLLKIALAKTQANANKIQALASYAETLKRFGITEKRDLISIVQQKGGANAMKTFVDHVEDLIKLGITKPKYFIQILNVGGASQAIQTLIDEIENLNILGITDVKDLLSLLCHDGAAMTIKALIRQADDLKLIGITNPRDLIKLSKGIGSALAIEVLVEHAALLQNKFSFTVPELVEIASVKRGAALTIKFLAKNANKILAKGITKNVLFQKIYASKTISHKDRMRKLEALTPKSIKLALKRHANMQAELSRKRRRKDNAYIESDFEATSEPMDLASIYKPEMNSLSIPGLALTVVPADGHCLYHAVAIYTGKSQDVLRNLVALHIEHNIRNFHEAILGRLNPDQTLEQYLAAVKSGQEWADNIEIVALMFILNRPIIVVDPELKIRSAGDGSQFTGEPIFVYYNGHNHYDGLTLTGSLDARSILRQLTEKQNPVGGALVDKSVQLNPPQPNPPQQPSANALNTDPITESKSSEDDLLLLAKGSLFRAENPQSQKSTTTLVTNENEYSSIDGREATFSLVNMWGLFSPPPPLAAHSFQVPLPVRKSTRAPKRKYSSR